MSELKLVKREADADELLAAAEASASTDSELVALSNLAAISLRTEAVLRLLDRLIALRRQAGSPPAAQLARGVSRTASAVMLSSGQIVYSHTGGGLPLVQLQLVEFLAKAERRDDLLAVWSRHLRLKGLAMAGQLGSSSLPQSGRPQGATQLSISGRTLQLMGGTNVFDWNDAQLLTAVSSGYRGAGPTDDLLLVFRRQAEAPDITRAERVLWLFARTHLLWWDNKREAALVVMAEVVELVPERIDLRLNLAQLYETIGQPTDALAAVEAIVSDSPDVRYNCEQRALRLALQTNRIDRAKVAAERLFDLKLPPHELLPLAEQMLRLDMPDQAEMLLARATTSTQGDVRAMRLLMDIQLRRDRLDEATQTATTLLQTLDRGGQMTTNATLQLTSTVSRQVVSQPVYSGMRALNAAESNEYRQAVFKVLHKTGKLTELIDATEAKLKESPTSETLIATLVSYHTAAENKRRVEELALMRHEIELNRPSNRYAAAIKCLDFDRTDDAIAHLKKLIENEPAYFASRCTDLVFRFNERKQLEPLSRLFDQIDWSLYDQHPQILPKVVELLLARADSHDHGTRLFLKQWQTRPYRRIEMLHRFLNDELWKLKEVSEGLRQIPFPTDAADVANQWSVFGRVLKHESDGTVLITVLNRILTALAERGELDAFAGDIEKRLVEWPKWTAGKVLLALVDLRRNRVEAGREALDGLLPALSKQFVNSPTHAWEIAQELVQHDASLDVGIRYYELALRERGVEAWTSSSSLTSSSSPGRAVIKTLAEHGRQRDARRLLLGSLPTGVQRGADGDKPPAPVELHVAQWIGRELRALGFSIDAIHVYQAALHRSEGMAIGGYDPRVELQSSLVVAFNELKPESLVEHLAIGTDEPPQLDLQLFVTAPKTPASKLCSRWTPLLETIAANAETAAALKAILAKARERHPDDLSALILATQLALAMKDVPDTKLLVARLVHHVEQHPLENLSTMPLIAEKQRHAAQSRVALWLIARECLAVPELEAAANKLTEAAVAAASQQSSGEFSAAITAELERPKPPAEVKPQ